MLGSSSKSWKIFEKFKKKKIGILETMEIFGKQILIYLLESADFKK